MVQSITDYKAFLLEAKRAVEELQRTESSLEQCSADEKKLERGIEAEKKAAADSIALTVKKRREEVNGSYDKEIAREQDKLKKVRAKREKAKNQGIKERIAEETAVLREHNREIRTQMKTSFQKDRVPGFCRSTWYYALYMPGSLKEILIFLMSFLVFFLALPYIIYLLIPERQMWHLIVIYVLDIVVFGGLYVVIGDKTKMAHLEALKTGKKARELIRSNDKKIKVIAGSIKRDRDEAVYNLEKFDDEISRLDQELAKIADKKKEALNTFDTVTKTIIMDEITANSKEKLDVMEEQLEDISAQRKKLEEEVKEMRLMISDKYESYIGREFLTPERLSELAGMIESGQAGNLREAIAQYQIGKQ